MINYATIMATPTQRDYFKALFMPQVEADQFHAAAVKYGYQYGESISKKSIAWVRKRYAEIYNKKHNGSL